MCKKVNLKFNAGKSLGSGLNNSEYKKFIESLNAGGLGLGNIDVKKLSGLGAHHKKTALNALNKFQKKMASEGKRPPRFNKRSLAKMMAPVMKVITPQLAKLGSSGIQKARALPSNKILPPTKNTKALSKKIKSKGLTFKGGKGIAKLKKGPSKKVGFSFDDEEGLARGGKIEGVMNKKYKYKDVDINKKENTSIWEILSGRYHKSGLRRLFGE